MDDLLPGLRGQERARRRLAAALDRGRLPHALAFVGPSGVGRALAARALARALHCAEAPRRGCGTCPACRRIDAGHHAGLEWLRPADGARTISVEAARDVRNRAMRAPLEGPAHVIVVDPAEALTVQAANALLKVLEEPPEGVYFMLLCAGLGGLLPTIASRCVPIRFGTLPAAEVESIMDEHLPELDGKTRRAALDLAAGRPGEALRLARDPSVPALLDLLAAARAAVAEGPSAVFAGDGGAFWTALAAAAKATGIKGTAGERAAALALIDLWALEARRDLLRAAGSGRGGAARAARLLERLANARAALERNASVRLCLEDLVLTLADDAPCDAA